MSLFGSIRAASDRYGPSQNVGQQSFFQNIFGSGKTHSGTTVTNYTAMNLPTVYCAVSLIADAIAMLPVDVVKKKGDNREVLHNHPVQKLLNSAPNPFMIPMTLRNTTTTHALLAGNGYQEIEFNGRGDPVGLWPLLPEATRPQKDKQTGEIYFQTVIDGTSHRIEKENVLHIPALGPDGYVGYSPITLHRQALGLAMATEEFGAKFFGNDAKSGGFLLHPGKLGEQAKDNLSDSMQKKGGLEHAHRVKVLEEGMKFITTTIPPEDAQFLGTREFQIAEIARIYRVPLVLLQAMTKATSWGSGIEQLMISFVTFTLMPWITRWEQEMTRKLLKEKEIADGISIKLNVNAVLRGDSAARATFYQRGITDGWMLRNEARALENLNPIDGLSEPLVPLNMVEDGAAPNQLPAPKNQPPEDDPEDELLEE